MPAEHALLGLLAMSEGGASHGYVLAQSFMDGQPLGDVLRLEPGMLYHHLKKLERHGWIESSTEAQANRPSRRTYRLNEAGRAELERWFAEPVTHTREIRLEFLVKLHFVRMLDPEQLPRLIREQREVLERLAASQERLLAGVEADSDFRRAVIDLRLAQTKAAIAWLDRAARILPVGSSTDPAQRGERQPGR
ncbi:MAG: PadR family transcriptional regulator [Thermomicrobiales bacterium]